MQIPYFSALVRHELIFIKGECIDEKETEMMRVRCRISSFFSQIPEKEQSPERSSVSKMFCEIHSKCNEKYYRQRYIALLFKPIGAIISVNDSTDDKPPPMNAR